MTTEHVKPLHFIVLRDEDRPGSAWPSRVRTPHPQSSSSRCQTSTAEAQRKNSSSMLKRWVDTTSKSAPLKGLIPNGDDSDEKTVTTSEFDSEGSFDDNVSELPAVDRDLNIVNFIKPRDTLILPTMKSFGHLTKDVSKALDTPSTKAVARHITLGQSALRGKDYSSAAILFDAAAQMQQNLDSRTANATADAVRECTSLAHARCLHLFCTAALHCRKAADTQPVATRAYETRYRNLGPLHVDTIDSFRILGLLYMKICDWESAVWSLSQVDLACRAVLGHKHTLVAETCGALARAYAKIGKVDKAKRSYDHACAACKDSAGLEDLLDTYLDEMYELGLSETRFGI